MKKISLFAVLASTSIVCYADSGIYTNMPTCYNHAGNDLNGCFQNKTGGPINELAIMQTAHYKNNTSSSLMANLAANQPNYFTGFTMSSAEFKKHNVVLAEYTIIAGDASAPKVIPGCKIQVNPNLPIRKSLTMVKISNKLVCK